MKIREGKFIEEYKPQVNHILRKKEESSTDDVDLCSFDGCMYETYGEEKDYILSLANDPKEKNRVWTIVECEDDSQGNIVLVYQAGYCLVNRLGFIVTEKPFESTECFVKIVFEMC